MMATSSGEGPPGLTSSLFFSISAARFLVNAWAMALARRLADSRLKRVVFSAKSASSCLHRASDASRSMAIAFRFVSNRSSDASLNASISDCSAAFSVSLTFVFSAAASASIRAAESVS